EGQGLLPDRGQDRAGDVPELKGLAQPQRLAVDEEDLLALLVGDPGVVADAEQPFPDEIAHAGQAIRGWRRRRPGISAIGSESRTVPWWRTQGRRPHRPSARRPGYPRRPSRCPRGPARSTGP